VRSLKRTPDNKRLVYMKLVGQIEGQLREAYAKRYEQGRENQCTIATKLDVDRSAVHRRLVGQTNMTVKTVADMVWALGHCIDVTISDPEEKLTNNHQIVPSFTSVGQKPASSTHAFRISGQGPLMVTTRSDNTALEASV